MEEKSESIKRKSERKLSHSVRLVVVECLAATMERCVIHVLFLASDSQSAFSRPLKKFNRAGGFEADRTSKNLL